MYFYTSTIIGMGLPRYKGIGIQIMDRIRVKDPHLWQGLKRHAMLSSDIRGNQVTWTLSTESNIPGFQTQVITPGCWRPGLVGKQYITTPGIKWPANSVELTETPELKAYLEANKEQLIEFAKREALEGGKMQHLIDVLEYAGLIQS